MLLFESCKAALSRTKQATCKQRVDVLLFESRKQRGRLKPTRFANGSGLCYSCEVAEKRYSLPVVFKTCPDEGSGKQIEAGSLGQVRQEPLNPCRETLREQAIARPGSYLP